MIIGGTLLPQYVPISGSSGPIPSYTWELMDMGYEIKGVTKITIHQNVDESSIFFFFLWGGGGSFSVFAMS